MPPLAEFHLGSLKGSRKFRFLCKRGDAQKKVHVAWLTASPPPPPPAKAGPSITALATPFSPYSASAGPVEDDRRSGTRGSNGAPLYSSTNMPLPISCPFPSLSHPNGLITCFLGFPRSSPPTQPLTSPL